MEMEEEEEDGQDAQNMPEYGGCCSAGVRLRCKPAIAGADNADV
jgi:hypothetical protein